MERNWHHHRSLSVILLLGAILFCSCSRAGSSDESLMYGRKINYTDGEPKKLPDITIRFLEKRKESSPAFKPGFTFFDFEAAKGAEKTKISWSSGTGDIGPTYFEIGGESYVLELAASEAYDGFLEDGEMVVWRRDEYEKMLAERRRP